MAALKNRKENQEEGLIMAAAIEVIISVEAATVTVLSMDGNLLFIEEQNRVLYSEHI